MKYIRIQILCTLLFCLAGSVFAQKGAVGDETETTTTTTSATSSQTETENDFKNETVIGQGNIRAGEEMGSDLPLDDTLSEKFDLNFVRVENSEFYDVKVQIRSGNRNGEFKMGSANLVFKYHKEALADPVLLESHHFSGEFYNVMYMSQPFTGMVSINIELFVPEYGTLVDKENIDVATIRFAVADSSKSAQLKWRKKSPNATIVFVDDEVTLLSNGKLKNWNESILEDATLVLDNTTTAQLNTLPTVFELSQNYPNPFNPTTTLKFALPEAAKTTLMIYNVTGQLVKTVVDNNLEAGYYNMIWDATNNNGQRVSSGVYFYRINAGSFKEVKKMILMK